MTEDDRFIDARANGELAAEALRNPLAVRERCGQLLARARRGESPWFTVHEDALDALAGPVADRLQQLSASGPLRLPSFWRLLEAGGIDRRARLRDLLSAWTPGEHAHALVDLAMIGVLLGDDPGPEWHYTEPATGRAYTGAQGLALATFHAFCAGLFSSHPRRATQADRLGLRALPRDRLAQALQVSGANPVAHLDARCVRLRRLGELMGEMPQVFGAEGRPGALFDLLIGAYGLGVPHTADLDAGDLLAQLLISLSGLWADGPQLGGVPLGDCVPHRAVRGPGDSDGWLPLHTLMQRLALSLLEPFEWSGVEIRGELGLTGLADEPPAHALLQAGVLQWRDPALGTHRWRRDEEPLAEWRGLTVALLDELDARMDRRAGRRHAGRQDREAATARIWLLAGGPWQAPSDLAQQWRPAAHATEAPVPWAWP